MSDLDPRWRGLRPAAPPAELRVRVLAAARAAAAQPSADPFDDRLLRLATAGLAALVVANLAMSAWETTPPSARPSPTLVDGIAVPADGGETAAQQRLGLESALGTQAPRSRR
jgi:hypothetical protein